MKRLFDTMSQTLTLLDMPEEILAQIFGYMPNCGEAYSWIFVCKCLNDVFIKTTSYNVRKSFSSDHGNFHASLQNCVSCITTYHKYFKPQKDYVCEIKNNYLRLSVSAKMTEKIVNDTTVFEKILVIKYKDNKTTLVCNNNTKKYSLEMSQTYPSREMTIIKKFMPLLYDMIVR